MDKKLKIFALEHIKKHDLSKGEKIALGEFVMNSDDNLIRFMLATGEVKDELTQKEISYLDSVKKELDKKIK